MHQYGVSANDVINALSLQNLITPVGTQKIGTYEYTVNLNDSPQAVKAFNDLPVKTVNGTVVYMRDVAYVHNGSPPQINAVHVNGASAVLLTIVKAGASSTLDIINGVKSLLPSVSQTLPSSLKLIAVGDQSVFVTDAVSSVIKEGLIAATLTGMMILLFLGSWRSTFIITLSIPLAILAALTGLSLLGETINVMTLGGLALAVGILVDDATVTMENINWHLEQGKEIEPAILDGARQIVVPATVSLLCICIAFVPMFGLGGVAGYLFRPLAEAVMLALAASYVLSRTLVPTLANYLLRNQHIHGSSDGVDHAPAKASRNPFLRFQRGFEHHFENVRKAYLGLMQLCLQNRIKVIAGFLVFSLLSFGLAPYLGQDFFPTVDGGQIKLHIRAPTGSRIEATTALADRIGTAIHGIVPANELDGIVSNIGLTVSGINMAYNNSGTIGVGDADILISLKPNHAPTDDYIKTMREKLPQQFPGTSFAFLPADIVSQVLNFGVPAPIDLQVAGRDLAANRKYANELLAKVRAIPGIADARIQQAFQQPTLNVNVDRSLTEKDVATAMLTTLSGSSQSAPTYWLDPANGVSYPVSVQTPQRDINTMTGLKNIPVTSSGAGAAQLVGGLANVERTNSNAVVSHYNVQPVIDIYATPQGRDLGALASDIQKVIHATAPDLPKGASVALRGQVSTMTSAYQQLFVGLAAAIVLIYLLIVINFQSWADPFVIVMALPTALAGIVWILFGTGTTLSVPALTGAIMCMGVATANSILVISFARERMAAGVNAMTAAFEAGGSRFRPVLMTALAMVIGMLPMAIEPGQNQPLGRAVIGGLIFATCATLFLVPTIFSLVHGRQRADATQADAATASSH